MELVEFVLKRHGQGTCGWPWGCVGVAAGSRWWWSSISWTVWGVHSGGDGVSFEETGKKGDLVMGMCWDGSRQHVVVVILLMDSMGSAQWGSWSLF